MAALNQTELRGHLVMEDSHIIMIGELYDLYALRGAEPPDCSASDARCGGVVSDRERITLYTLGPGR